MPGTPDYRLLRLLIGVCCFLSFVPAVRSQDLDLSLEEEAQINREAASSQQRVSGLAGETDELLSEYRTVLNQTHALRRYDDNLERLVADQRAEVDSINGQLAGLEQTHREIVPLMFDMIDALDRIVEADLPFRLAERRARVARLRGMMGQSEVTTAEKYRRVMEAYQGELEYGRSTEAYADVLPDTGQTVSFLRVGRTLLAYQTPDGAVTGWYNPATRRYEELPDRYRLEVKKGLAIARNERAPDLVVLPVPAPEEQQ